MIYDETLRHLIDAGAIPISDKVLVICGGPYDADVMRELGFKNVTLCNLDAAYVDAGYVWERQDAD